MRPFPKIAILAAVALLAAPAFADVEITPFGAYRFGGEFESREDFIDIGLEVEDTEALGVLVALDLNRDFQLEFLWSHQESTLLEEGFFFEDEILFDLDVDYLHVGVAYQWSPGQLRPFFGVSLGATQFAPVGGLSDETRFSMSLGGGVKLMANEHFGVRFEGRGFATLVDENDDDFVCDRFDCYNTGGDDYFTQFETRVGLIFRF